MLFYLQINVIFTFELLVVSFKFQGFHSKFFIKILFNHRTPLNSLDSLRDRLTQKITKYVWTVCDLVVFRWTENNSELWYIAILQKNSHLKNSVFWFSLVIGTNLIHFPSIKLTSSIEKRFGKLQRKWGRHPKLPRRFRSKKS